MGYKLRARSKPQVRRSKGEAYVALVEAQRALLKANRAFLVSKYAGMRTWEVGAKVHAHGHGERGADWLLSDTEGVPER